MRRFYLGIDMVEESGRLSLLLEVNETIRLSVSDNPMDLSGITFRSSDPSIAIVDADGIVTAVSEGEVEIYAENAERTFQESIPVKVVQGAAELRLAVHLAIGEKARLYITEELDKVTWTSMDESVAVVSASGQITAVSEGLALILVDYEGESQFIYVRVGYGNTD